MVDFARAQATATRLIKKNGRTAKVRRPGGVTRISGVEIINQPSTFDAVGVQLDFDPKEIDGTRVKAGDVQFLCTAQSALEIGDYINLDGKDYRVVNPKPFKPNGLVILYQAHCTAGE